MAMQKANNPGLRRGYCYCCCLWQVSSTLRSETSADTLDELAHRIEQVRDESLSLRVESRHDDNGQKGCNESY